jgi:hypothetical protein
MFSQTRRALEDFDNQHDFERMAADILNSLGYLNVEPMAPAGGPDGGRDIQFRDGDARGIAFVTLDKDISKKFKFDLSKQEDADGVIALFCNVGLSPDKKLAFAKAAISKGYRLEPFDLERLRSLLDSGLRDIRCRYLKIDDEKAIQLKSSVRKLLRFPEATADSSPSLTIIESLLAENIPKRLFDLLIDSEETDIKEVPEIGAALHDHLIKYYEFRTTAQLFEQQLTNTIGGMVEVEFPRAWQICLRYVEMRYAGHTKEAIISGGTFLNYGITWDEAERVFILLFQQQNYNGRFSTLLSMHKTMSESISRIRNLLAGQ